MATEPRHVISMGPRQPEVRCDAIVCSDIKRVKDSMNAWVNNGEAGDLRRHRAPYGVIVMFPHCLPLVWVFANHTPPYIWPLMQSFSGFIIINMGQLLNNRMNCMWFSTPCRPCDVTVIISKVYICIWLYIITVHRIMCKIELTSMSIY